LECEHDKWERSGTLSYYFSKTLDVNFADAVLLVIKALKAEGFGIVTEIDMQKTLKTKLNVEFREYRILGACNPSLAYDALQIESKVGTMLPCNVIVQDIGGGKIEIASIDPVASMQAIDNPKLKAATELVRAKLKAAIAAI